MKILSSTVFCVALIVLTVITNGLRVWGMEYTDGVSVIGACDGDIVVGTVEGIAEGVVLGVLDGITVGVALVVGILVGITDGRTLGLAVVVGSWVGRAVGFVVVTADGLAVGLTVGFTVGASVSEGTAVGADPTVVKAAVGVVVKAAIGAFVEAADGTAVEIAALLIIVTVPEQLPALKHPSCSQYVRHDFVKLKERDEHNPQKSSLFDNSTWSTVS